MARKGWSDLSPKYRDRLKRNGISRRAYESGASLSAARGHSGKPTRRKGYRESQKKLEKKLRKYHGGKRHGMVLQKRYVTGGQYIVALTEHFGEIEVFRDSITDHVASAIGTHWDGIKMMILHDNRTVLWEAIMMLPGPGQFRAKAHVDEFEPVTQIFELAHTFDTISDWFTHGTPSFENIYRNAK